MKLKVANPGCKCCNKKIKKLLCKFPEIRDQTFNEKDDTVIIKVVCCNPEKIRTKLMCKGCKIITYWYGTSRTDETGTLLRNLCIEKQENGEYLID
ncbi:unnamed protein product, partial [Vitis vinifera]